MRQTGMNYMYMDINAPQTADQLGTEDDGSVRTFDTGATRDTGADKVDFEGFLSPLVIERFGEYMLRHQQQSDGTIRPSDNWQKGIPQDVYMKSGFRHFMDWWLCHRDMIDHPLTDKLTEEALCALLFNVQGYLHEHLKKNR